MTAVLLRWGHDAGQRMTCMLGELLRARREILVEDGYPWAREASHCGAVKKIDDVQWTSNGFDTVKSMGKCGWVYERVSCICGWA